MKLRIVAPRRGAAWVHQGFGVFLKRPLAFTGLFILFMLLGQVLMLFGLVGALLVFSVMPLASLGFMIATRHALQGRFPAPAAFIEPLRSGAPRRRGQIRLGLAYAVCAMVVFWIADALVGPAFEQLQEAVRSGNTGPGELEPLLSDGGLLTGMLWLLGAGGLLAVPFWHAPALVHWGDQEAAKALFSSTVAWWRNKGALVVYSLTWLGVVMLFALVSNLLVALFGQPQLMVLLITPGMLMISTAFYASLYFTFADSFEPPDDAAAPLTPPTETP